MSATCEFQSITRTVESPPWWKESKQCQCGSKIEVGYGGTNSDKLEP